MGSSEDRVTPRSLEQSLDEAQSPDWQRRSAAASALAAHVDEPVAVEQLVKLLDDADTAVIDEAARSLATAAGLPGLAEVLTALATSQDDVGYHLRDTLVGLWLDGSPILERCRAVLAAGFGPQARAGASEMISILAGE